MPGVAKDTNVVGLSGIRCYVKVILIILVFYRWACTGVLNGIAKHKKIVWEPRRSGEFEYLMKEFYQAIEESADSPVGRGVTGALFIAVCRGKVSEGLDFADKNARVVITVSAKHFSFCVRPTAIVIRNWKTKRFS